MDNKTSKTMKNQNIAILGLGNFGTAVGNLFAKMGHNVLGWSINEKIVKSVNQDAKNIAYFPDLKLDENLKATSSIEDVLNRKIIFSALPAKVLKSVFSNLNLSSDHTLISCSKGMADEPFLTPLQLAEKVFSRKPQLAVLSGPGFAKDIVLGKPTGWVLASKDIETSKTLANNFSNEILRLYISNDTLGVELGGILKNIIAIASGISDSLNLGESARAAIITRGLAEMVRLSEALGIKKDTLYGLSGLGDLILTSVGDASRNRTVGLRLGKGEKLETIISSLGSVAEGVRSTPLVLKLAKSKSVEMPITEKVNLILEGKVKPEDAKVALLERAVREE